MLPYNPDTALMDLDACLEEVRRRHNLSPFQAMELLLKQHLRLKAEATTALPPPGLTPEQLVGWATADAPQPYHAPANLTGLRLRILSVMKRYAEERVYEATADGKR